MFVLYLKQKFLFFLLVLVQEYTDNDTVGVTDIDGREIKNANYLTRVQHHLACVGLIPTTESRNSRRCRRCNTPGISTRGSRGITS